MTEKDTVSLKGWLFCLSFLARLNKDQTSQCGSSGQMIDMTQLDVRPGYQKFYVLNQKFSLHGLLLLLYHIIFGEKFLHDDIPIILYSFETK